MPGEHLKAQQRAAPDSPGVYFFRDVEGRPLYIGKAKSLRKRLASHLSSPSTRGGVQLLDETVQLDWILADTEWQALLLEQELISREQPTYNVALRFGRHYPRLAVSWDEQFPRIYLAREDPVPGRRYFGPYHPHEARELLRLLTRLFLFRSCEGARPGRVSGSPCLDYFIKRCEAPCVGYIDENTYRARVAAAQAALAGDWRHAEAERERRMRQAAQELRFEEAAALRDEFETLERLRGRDRTAVTDDPRPVDALGLARDGDAAEMQLLRVRDGALAGRERMRVKAGSVTDAELVREALLTLYADGEVPELVLVPEVPDDAALVCRLLGERRGQKVSLRAPQRGPLRAVADLAARNAADGLSRPAPR